MKSSTNARNYIPSLLRLLFPSWPKSFLSCLFFPRRHLPRFVFAKFQVPEVEVVGWPGVQIDARRAARPARRFFQLSALRAHPRAAPEILLSPRSGPSSVDEVRTALVHPLDMRIQICSQSEKERDVPRNAAELEKQDSMRPWKRFKTTIDDMIDPSSVVLFKRRRGSGEPRGLLCRRLSIPALLKWAFARCCTARCAAGCASRRSFSPIAAPAHFRDTNPGSTRSFGQCQQHMVIRNEILIEALSQPDHEVNSPKKAKISQIHDRGRELQ